MAIQRLEEVPAICENKKCSSYKAWETVDVEDILDDEVGGYVYCPECLERIDIHD